MNKNPLSEEQIEELNEIAKLSVEEQKVKLNNFFKKLTPEQIEFLKSQQGQQCVFCAISEGKISAKKIYEDDYLIGALDITPANKGHIILFPKVHYEILAMMKDVGHLFNVANKISSVVFEITKAEGTNIIVSNGFAAGQKTPHVAVHIIPRFNGDKVNIGYEKVNISEEEMNNIIKLISSKLQIKPIENKREIGTVKYFRERERIP